MRHVRKITLLALLALALTIGALLLAGPSTAQSDDPVIRAQQVLLNQRGSAGFRSDLSDLRVLSVRQGLSAEHVRYQQTAHGLPVFGAYVSVSLPKDRGAQPSLASRYVAGLQPNTPVPALTSAEALANALGKIGADSSDLQAPASSELVYYPGGKRGYVLAWQVVASTMSPLGSWLVFVDAAAGEVLYKHDLIRYDSGRVFDPNPAKTNGGTAPAPDCDTAAKEALLAGQYRTKDLLGIDAGQNKLKGAYADLTAPGIPNIGYKAAGQANEASRNYVYPCTDDRFEEVMAYYHVDATQRKLQSLGFTGQSAVYDSPAPIHAHWFPDCNAFYHPISRGLHFGDSVGCPFVTDLAEDADVVVHEYGHALQDEQIPGWGFGPYPLAEQAASMGEGFSDFLAAVIFGDPCLGEYANFGNTTCGGSPGLRWLQNSRAYPAGFEDCPDVDFTGDGFPESEEPHCGGEVWGGVLWDLIESLPGGVNQANRDLALTLVIDAQFYLDPVATFNEAAAAVCLADTALYGGAHVSAISAAFAGRGITTAPCAASDFPYLYLRILHTFSGDLDINVKVGANVNTPVCQFVILNGPIFFPGPFVAYGSLTTPADCASHLPPTTAQPWWLEVRDQFVADVGTIENFEISLVGGTRCVAGDTPVAIPDNNGFVYSKVDCTTQSGPPGSTTPTPTPGPQTPTPSITGSSPPSPANDNNPEIFGSAVASSTVSLFTNAGCSGSPVATGSAATFASPGLTVSVPDNSSTTFYANATVTGNTSGCSLGFTYVEDSTQSTSQNSITSLALGGAFSSLALDASGNPVVSYFGGNSDLSIVHCNDANCAGDDESITFPDIAGTVGFWTSLALDASGDPVVSYYDLTNENLKLVHCDDANCAPGGDSITSPDTVGIVGEHTSLALDASGNPVVSYRGFTITGLKLLHCNDPNCDGVGDSINFGHSGLTGNWTSLAIDASGNPVVSYSGLNLLHCNDPNCDGAGDSIATPHPGGNYTSLALDANGNPVVSYSVTGGLHLLHCNDVNCAPGGDLITALDTPIGPGGVQGTSLALDASGNPVVAYFDASNFDLKVLHCNDPNCAGGDESPTSPDTTGLVGYYPSLALDPGGNPIVSYMDGTTPGAPHLKLLHCGNPTCSDGEALGYYHPVDPCRIWDTRPGEPAPGPKGKVQQNAEIMVDVTGLCGVPNSGVSAVVVNVTVAEPTVNSFLTVFPSDAAQPNASNLNFVAGQTVPNLVTVKVGADGNVKVYNKLGSTHVIFDVVGWYGGLIDGSRFSPLAPKRILDTRPAPYGPIGVPTAGKIGPGQTITVDVTDTLGSGVPPTGVTAVVINTTATEPTTDSFLTVHPADAPLPNASNLNFVGNQTLPNLVIVKVGVGGANEGKVKVYNKLGSTHVIFDVVGWYGGSATDLFHPLPPCRSLDTRPEQAPPGPKGKVSPNSSIPVDVTGVCAVPPSGATGVIVNTTVTEPTDYSYLTVYPSNVAQPPLASNLNVGPGQTIPNLVIVRTGPDGNVRAYNKAGHVHVVMDTVGYFGP